MADTAPSHVLRLKIGDRKVPGGGDAGAVKRAFRMACARAATAFSGLDLVLTSMRHHDVELDALLAQLDDVPGLFMLRGPGDAQGLAVPHLSVLSGIIEHATTGRVLDNLDEDHKPTRTEMVIFADFLDQLLPMIVAEVEELPNPPQVLKFKYDRTMSDARAVEMAMENVGYRRYELMLELDGGRKAGLLQLYLPLQIAGAGAGSRKRSRGWREDWQEQIDSVPVCLEAVLFRTKKPLCDIVEFSPGDLLRMPIAQLENVQIRGRNRIVIARGKLGRQGACRAIRIDGNVAAPKLSDTTDSFDQARAPSTMAEAGELPPLQDPIASVVPPPQPLATPTDIGTPAPLPGLNPIEESDQVGAAPMPMAMPIEIDGSGG